MPTKARSLHRRLIVGSSAVRVPYDNLPLEAGEAIVPSTYQIERNRGTKEARQQLAVLQEKWPLAFPGNHQDIRPLAVGTAGEIAVETGWSVPYTLGVLVRWKMAPAYCQAILRYGQRVALDGSPAETVDAEAKELATKQLARLAERETARKATKVAPSPVVKPKPAAPPTKTRPETPDQLRGRVRASLLRRRA